MPDHEALLAAWVRGWAASRGVGAPVWDQGAWRVDVGAPEQTRRFVFPALTGGVSELAALIDETCIFIKVCAAAEAVRAVLPARWAVHAQKWMMVCANRQQGVAAIPPGYALAVMRTGAVVTARISGPDGAVVATGHVLLSDNVVVYDRIATAAAHQRRGLGRALMLALEDAAGGHGVGGHGVGVLVATAPGAALYRSLGWSVHSPYASAVIEGA